MSDLTNLRNIGLRSAEWLNSVGIRTLEDLAEIGVVGAYMRTKDAFPDQVTLNLLYALQAATLDIDWKQVPESMKRDLREQVSEYGAD